MITTTRPDLLLATDNILLT